jgi:CheY-like chemotaxis protein
MALPGTSDIAAQPLHVLIVDDNHAAALTTGWLLETLDHTFETAGSAADALRRAIENVPDIVLVDIGLPGTDGYALCEQLKRLEALAETVLVAHSGYGEEKHRKRAADAGCSHFLLKPFELRELQRILDEVANRKKNPSAMFRE